MEKSSQSNKDSVTVKVGHKEFGTECIPLTKLGKCLST